jgi:hypothetical protein
LLLRAATELKPRSIRFPLLGEYSDCFTGDEFVAWLNTNVSDFDGNLDRAEDAARELTERDGLLRRIGEFGNEFEHSDEAYYQFRPKVGFDSIQRCLKRLFTPPGFRTWIRDRNCIIRAEA